MKFWADLTNGDDIAQAGPSSYGSGRHGFGVDAETMDEACAKVRSRAKGDGFWGCDWSAQISALGPLGQKDWWTAQVVNLY
jgi:hypothetical protein